jgi:hypothetical protein
LNALHGQERIPPSSYKPLNGKLRIYFDGSFGNARTRSETKERLDGNLQRVKIELLNGTARSRPDDALAEGSAAEAEEAVEKAGGCVA